MKKFSDAVAASKSAEVSRTWNGMKAFATSDSKVLDLFGKIGNARKSSIDLSGLFNAALAENEELAIRVLLWARDVRGGAGERNTFRKLLQAIEKVNPALAGSIMPKIPFLGRADDLFAYQDPINRAAALEFFADALRAGDGLFFKWSPREKSAKKAVAFELMKTLGMNAREYRKFLADNTKVVETAMCAKEWNSINFSHVPSLAAARYQKAFTKNAGTQYAAYIRELQKPEADRDPKVKINAAAVYPYDIVKSLRMGNAAVADAQFAALPNYIGDSKILPIVDVSGSMGTSIGGGVTTAMDVAISLGLYLSANTSSDFKDMFVTFSEKPKIQVLQGTLSQKFSQLARAEWGYNTNLEAAMTEILRVAKKGSVAPENMPNVLLVLSDMQFDQCTRYDDNAFGMIKRKFEDAGYRMPQIVFWNLTAEASNTPVKTNDKGVALVSGFSPAIMSVVLGADPEEFTPMNMMLKTIMSDRYDF